MEPFRTRYERLAEQGRANPGQHRPTEDQRDSPPQVAAPAVVGWNVEIIMVGLRLDDHAPPDDPRQHTPLKTAIGNEIDRAVGTDRIVAHQVRCDLAHCGTNCRGCGCYDFLPA